MPINSDVNKKIPDPLIEPNVHINVHIKKEKEVVMTRVVGVTAGNRQNTIKNLRVTQDLRLLREPSNRYDRNAIAVFSEDMQIGYIDRELALRLAPILDKGKEYKCYVNAILGGGNYQYYGVSITILVYDTGAKTTFVGYREPSYQKTQQKSQEQAKSSNGDNYDDYGISSSSEDGGVWVSDYYFEHHDDYENYIDSLNDWD